MKIAFFSNYLSHHQLPFCLEMHKRLGNGFSFVATQAMRQERIDLGYPDLNKEYPFVVEAYADAEQEHRAKEIATAADVVMIGSAPKEYIQQRLQEGKLTFLYSERLYKNKLKLWKWPVYLWRFYRTYGKYKNYYLLCASAYTAGDFAKTFTFINKSYKWGYFPEVKTYDITTLMAEKKAATILWAGRFIDWKHPEYVIEVAKRLKADGYKFEINMLGTGILWESLNQMVQDNQLEDCVYLLGAMPPDQVRNYMEKSAIYLFTSDRNEGWGAVLNESMNSGCAVVASDAIGAVPFLMDNNENGLIYRSGDVGELYQKVKFLLDHPEECNRLGANAYTTMTNIWNAEIAAERLLQLSHVLLSGNEHPDLFREGPCSKARIL